MQQNDSIERRLAAPEAEQRRDLIALQQIHPDIPCKPGPGGSAHGYLKRQGRQARHPGGEQNAPANSRRMQSQKSCEAGEPTPAKSSSSGTAASSARAASGLVGWDWNSFRWTMSAAKSCGAASSDASLDEARRGSRQGSAVSARAFVRILHTRSGKVRTARGHNCHH